jgi:hypothetical protein
MRPHEGGAPADKPAGIPGVDAVLERIGAGFSQRRTAGHLERDMREPKLSALRPWHSLRCGMLRNVDGMKAVVPSPELAAAKLWACPAMRNPARHSRTASRPPRG